MVETPALARQPCRLPRVPAEGLVTWADLEAAYVQRGEAIVACEMARRLAVEAHQAERAAVRAWATGTDGPEP